VYPAFSIWFLGPTRAESRHIQQFCRAHGWALHIDRQKHRPRYSLQQYAAPMLCMRSGLKAILAIALVKRHLHASSITIATVIIAIAEIRKQQQ